MRALLVVLLCTLVSALPAYSEETTLEQLEAANLRLRAEYDLASQRKVYFVFDLLASKVSFRASGVTVAALPITSLRQWGVSEGNGVRSLVSKESLVKPERDVITVGEVKSDEEAATNAGDEKKFELDALELADMPTSFQLHLDDGTLISVNSAPEGGMQRLWWQMRKFYWLLSRPLISDWNFLRKRTYTELMLTMPAKDAQLLYWSFTDGSNCLLLR